MDITTLQKKQEELAQIAIKLFSDAIHPALLGHIDEFLADPTSKNAADVLWLTEALISSKINLKPHMVEVRFDELLERYQKTGSLKRE